MQDQISVGLSPALVWSLSWFSVFLNSLSVNSGQPQGGGGEEEGGKEKGRRGGAAGLLRGDGRWGAGFFQLILHALTFAIDGDGFCVVEESIEDC